MQIYDELKCRDPRDRIYALLAISSDTTQLSIKPDYSASISEVFRMVTIYILRQASDLQVLRFACYWDNTTESAHPSWVLNGPRDQHLTTTMGFHSGGYTPHPRQLFSAPHLPLDSFTLILKGRILDRVSFSTPPTYWPLPYDPDYRVNDFRKQSEHLKNLSRILFKLGVTAENTAALFRAMIATPSWSPPDRQHSSVTIETAYHFWCSFRLTTFDYRYGECSAIYGIEKAKVLVIAFGLIEKMTAFLAETDRVEPFRPDNELSKEELAIGSDCIGMEMEKGRSFCTTQEGRVGNCMHEVKEGDVIAAFQDADFLCVLRPVGDKYRLIGDAYVDGLMRGEAYKGIDPDEVDYDIILI